MYRSAAVPRATPSSPGMATRSADGAAGTMGHPDFSSLKGAIERLVANHASAQDRKQVQAALAAGALSIATGQRAVSLGGDAQGAVFVTGDGNVILRIDALAAAAIEWLAKRSHPSPLHQLPADIADFAGRGAQVEKLM